MRGRTHVGNFKCGDEKCSLRASGVPMTVNLSNRSGVLLEQSQSNERCYVAMCEQLGEQIKTTSRTVTDLLDARLLQFAFRSC